LKVGVVFDVGGRGDKSFNDSAYEGLARAERELGIQGTYLEPEKTEDRESALRLFASRGYDLIFGVGFIFSSDVDAVARDYPQTSFACIDYFSGPSGPPPNVSALAFREEEGSFLVGAVAGLLSKSKNVGFVGGMTGPLIKKFETGFAFGVRQVCADCKVHSAYAGTSPDAYHDPSKGKAIALSHAAKGADVIYHASGATGQGVFEGAREAKVVAIGVDSDQHDEMPGVVVTSMVKRIDTAVFNAIHQKIEGKLKGGMQSFGLREAGVDYVKEGPHAEALSQATKAKVDALSKEVAEGRLIVPSKE
jgi:basic membrane protein A and related proteins